MTNRANSERKAAFTARHLVLHAVRASHVNAIKVASLLLYSHTWTAAELRQILREVEGS